MTERTDNPTNRKQHGDGANDRTDLNSQNTTSNTLANQNRQSQDSNRERDSGSNKRLDTDPDSSLDQPDPDPDDDQYGNLDEPQMDLYGNLEELEMARYADPDAEAQDQYGEQNPIGSSNDPDTPGGLGIYDVQDQYGSDQELVPPGSDEDQYRTRGSQDQYGNQQNIK